jgi:hypothetical protein
MRTFLITLTALVAVALPAVTANAQDRTVIVKKDGHHDRGLHRGWTRGHHYGWRNHNAKVVALRRNIITTIDLFWSDESKNPVLVAGFFAFGCGGTNSRCKD